MTRPLHHRAAHVVGKSIGFAICEPQLRLGRWRHDGVCDWCDEPLGAYSMEKLCFPDIDLDESTRLDKIRTMWHAEYARVCLECSVAFETDETETASDNEPLAADTSDDPRRQELLWPERRHPDELILPDAHPTRFPGTWVAIYEEFIPADQRHALMVEGYRIDRIQLFGDRKAQVVIREEPRPDRDGELSHAPTDFRYKDYDPRAPREYLGGGE